MTERSLSTLVNLGIAGDEDVAKEISGLIIDGKHKLLDVVQLLGDYLTKDDENQRAKATGLISGILTELPRNNLKKQQVDVITGFLVDRLEDESSLEQVAKGLQAVSQMANFSVSDITNILKELKEINMRKHVQNVRYEVYKLLNVIITEHEPHLLQISDMFISTFVELTNGEKDPRNLLISFKISHKILTTFDISSRVQDLYDITFCYFPITFEPPKNDPYGITSQDLKQALRNSISANGLFAEFAFSDLVERLNSSVESVKRDTFETMLACLENYDSKYIDAEWQTIWDGVKYEVLHGSDEEDDMNNLALKVLQTLGSNIGDKYLDAVKEETLEKLEDPAGKFIIPAAKLTSSVARSSVKAFEELREFVIPKMLAKYSESPTVQAETGILNVLILFLAASEESNGMEKYKDEVIAAFAKALMGANKDELALRKLAITGFSVICSLKKLPTREEIGLIVQYLDDTVLKDDNEELCDAALVSLSKISDMYPDIIVEITFPAFLAELPDSDIDEEFKVTANARKSIDFILSALASVSVTREVFERLKTRLLFKLDVVATQSSHRYPLAIISTMLAVIHKLDEKKQDVTVYIETLITPLFNKIIKGTETLQHETVVDAAGTVAEFLVRRLDELNQAVWATKVTDAFVENNSNGIHAFDVFSRPTNIAQLLTLSLAPVSSKVPINGSRLIQKAVEMLAETRIVFQRGAYLRLVALCSNKWIKQRIEFNVPTQDSNEALNELEIAAYYAKGLVLRNDQQGYDICAAVIDLLPAELGNAASKAFGVVVCDDPVLSKENKIVVRLLAKQRLFAFVLPKLTSGKSHQESYLAALASLLRYTPSKILVPELEKFLPLLLESIAIPNPRVQEAAVDTVLATLAESASLLGGRIDSLVRNLLDARDTQKTSSVSVRISALKCLGALPLAIQRSALEPYRQQIINALRTSLEDPKRAVRRDAVQCRQQYFEM